jgi:hypothetical protein
MMRGVIAFASAVVLSACTSDQPHPPVTPSTAVPTPFIRECGSAAFGELNMKNAVTCGPLVLVGIPQAAVESRRVFGPHEGRYYAVKVLAVVRGTDDVTVSVSEDQRGSVALLYDPDARANKTGFLFSAGDPSVRFGACPGGDSGYPGGFIAKHPICVTLNVQTKDSSVDGSIPLGVGRSCPD